MKTLFQKINNIHTHCKDIMENSIQKIEQIPFEYTQEKLDLLKNTVCKGSSNDEFELFLHVCKRTRLDPFMKQIYSIPRGGQRTIQTSIDGLRLIAERTNRYSPGKESTYTYDEKGGLIASTSFVKKMTLDGTWHEIAFTAMFSEYNPGNNTFWKKMPHVMLAKCAEAGALRKAFPNEMSGVYIKEEMDQAEPATISCEVEASESPEESCEKLATFMVGYPVEDHDYIKSYFEKYSAHYKKTIGKSIEDYSDKEKFAVDLEKWKKRPNVKKVA